jgi:hypothetical protein
MPQEMAFEEPSLKRKRDTNEMKPARAHPLSGPLEMLVWSFRIIRLRAFAPAIDKTSGQMPAYRGQ